MTCRELRLAIDAYLDEELAVLETRRVQEHLEQCDGCRGAVASETTLHALLAADAVRDVPPARLRDRILGDLGAAEPGGHPGSRWRLTPALHLVLAGAVAVILLLGILLVLASRPVTTDAVVWHLDGERAFVDLELRTMNPAEVTSWLESRLGLSVSFPIAAPGENAWWVLAYRPSAPRTPPSCCTTATAGASRSSSPSERSASEIGRRSTS